MKRALALVLLLRLALAFRPVQSPSSTTMLQASRFRNVDEFLEQHRNEPLLLVFTSSRCGPCKLQYPELDSVKEMVSVFLIDTDRWPSVGTQFRIGKLPSMLMLQDGEEKPLVWDSAFLAERDGTTGF